MDNQLPSEISETPKPPGINRRERLCIVTGELAGPFYNGGIGTTNRALAFTCRMLGYEVDVLYTHVSKGEPFSLRGLFSEHIETFSKHGVRLQYIPNESEWFNWQQRSYLALKHLQEHKYDLVFFDDMEGTGYYPLLARHTGCPDLVRTCMCVTAHSATQWIKELNHTAIDSIDTLRLMEMERRSLELADVVKAPSAYILRKYESYGWVMPSDTIILPNLVSHERTAATSSGIYAIDELVFFGRLEERKGLWIFCRAIDRIKYRLTGHTVTFLGKLSRENARALLHYSATWPFAVRIIANFDQDQALNYLRVPGRLAVMPAPEDNSPSTIIECLQEGIPFIAASGSGGEELLDDESGKSSLFEPSVDGLADKLIEVLERGVAVSAPAVSLAGLVDRYNRWIKQVLDRHDNKRAGAEREVSLREDQRSHMVVLIPPKYPYLRAIEKLKRAISNYDRKIQLFILAEHPSLFFEMITAAKMANMASVFTYTEFEKCMSVAVASDLAMIGLCHIDQFIEKSMMHRADRCFTLHPDIVAVTGMIGSAHRSVKTARMNCESQCGADIKVERFLLGRAPPLFALSIDTNSGFVVLRANALTATQLVVPFDPQYQRLKRMQDWVHEILVRFHAMNLRFEIIPDDLTDQKIAEAPFEVFRVEKFMRSIPRLIDGISEGSTEMILSRTGVDIGLFQERALAHQETLANIAERIGTNFEQLPLYSPWEEQVRQLAYLAQASGQMELAVDLCASLGVQETSSKPIDLESYVKMAAENMTVNIVEVFASTHHITGDARVSLWGAWDRRRIEIELGSMAPRSVLSAAAIDLSKCSHFATIVEILDKTSLPVRFGVEVAAPSERAYWSAEKVLYGGDESVWTIECPRDLPDKCFLYLSVEIVGQNYDSDKITVRWINPRFFAAE